MNGILLSLGLFIVIVIALMIIAALINLIPVLMDLPKGARIDYLRYLMQEVKKFFRGLKRRD